MMLTEKRPRKRSMKSWLIGLTAFASLLVASHSVDLPHAYADVNYLYDENSRLRAVTDASGNIAEYRYDAVGNITAIVRYTSGQLGIIEFTPNEGPVGTSVTIYGSGFASTINGNTVKFNGKTATVTFASVTKLVATVPSAATTGTISVKVGTTTVTSLESFTVSSGVTAAPTITSFSPTIAAAGTAVSITGTNFDTTPNATKVQLNQAMATATISSTTSISMTVPASAASGKIKVTTPLGIATSASDFIVPPPGVAPANIAASTRLTVNGPAQPLAVNTLNKYGLVLFDASPGDDLVINLGSISTVPANTEISYMVYKPDNTSFAYGYVSSANPFIFLPKIQTVGTHVVTFFSAQATFSMSLSLKVNTDMADLIPDGTPTTVTPTQPSAVRRYRFTASPGQKFGLGFTNVTHSPANGANTYVYVYPPAGYSVGSCYTIATAKGCGITIGPAAVSQTYTVVITPPTGAAVGGTLTLSTDITGTLTPNVASSVQVVRQGQNATLTFTGTANQRVSMSMSDSTIQGSVLLYLKKPDGEQLSWALSSGASGFLDVQTLPTAGTYSIFFDPIETYVGSATLLLYDVPADVTGTIVPGGQPVTVTTTTPGQNGILTFTGAANQRVSVAASGITMGRTLVYLKRPDGTTQMTLDTPSSLFMDPQTLATAGTYSILVDPTGTGVGSATITLYDVPPDAIGTIVPGGPPVTITTTVPGQNANLTFTGAANQRVSLAMSGSTLGYTYLYLKKPDGTTLASTWTAGTTAYLDIQTLPTAGTYSILVDPFGPGAGNATLTLYDASDITGTIVPDGPPVTVTTTLPGQNANLTFTGAANQRVSLEVSGSTLPGVNYVSLKKPDGTTLTSLAFFGATGFIDAQTLPTAGTYSVFLDPQGTAVGSATLKLNNVPADVTGPIVAGGSPVAVTTTVPGQNANLTFTGAVNQRVSLTVSGSTYPGVNYVYLKKPDGTTLTSVGFFGATGFIDVQTLPTAGTYSVFLDPQGTVVGSATLQLYNVPADVTGPIVAGGSPVAVTTTVPGQNVNLTFTGAVNQRVSLTVSGSTYPGIYYVYLKKPDGTTLTSVGFIGATGFIDVQTLPTAGTYSVFLDPQGTAVGNATLQLYNVPADVTGTMTIGGAAVPVSFSVPGQNARITFGGAQGQQVTVGITSNTISYLVATLLKPDGTTLASITLFGASGNFPAQNLPTAGTYTVVLDPQGDRVGSLSLSATSP